MNALWLILGIGAGVYAMRLSGLVLPDIALPPQWEQALHFVPVALLSALVTLSLTDPAGGDTSRILAALGAGLVVYRTRKMWTCIVSGMALFWALRFIS